MKRALAKQPVDRFQSAGELSAALADAASQPQTASGAVVGSLPTAANTPGPPPGGIDDVDETTVVRPRDEFAAASSHQFEKIHRTQSAATADRFNPWRII